MQPGVLAALLPRQAVLALAVAYVAILLVPWSAVAASTDSDALRPVGTWVLVNPWPQGNALYDSALLGPLTSVAVGANGTIMRTTDGGASWDVSHIADGEDLWALSFPDGAHGWAVGDDGTILATADGGRTWSQQQSGVRGRVVNPTFVDQHRGWTSCGQHVLRTTDGGASWEQLPEPPWQHYVDVLTFVDRNTGWAAVPWTLAGRGCRLYQTIDGGLTWEPQIDLLWEARDMEWLDSSTGWVVTQKNVFRTADGGKAWQPIWEASWEPYSKSPQIKDVEFASATEGLAVAERRDEPMQLWRTVDGGGAWLPVFDMPSSKQPGGLSLDRSGAGMVVGLEGYLASTAPGDSTWHRVSRDVIPDGWSPSGIMFADSAHGWLFCSDEKGEPVNLQTGDGSRTWRKQAAPFDDAKVYDFPDPTHGWALMDTERNDDYFACISVSVDGGETWRYVAIPGAELWTVPGLPWATFPGRAGGLDFFSARNGWVVGTQQLVGNGEYGASHGIVLHTLDGGDTWTRTELAQGEYARAVAAIGPRAAVVVGSGSAPDEAGFLLSTLNGGLTWSRRDFAGLVLLDIAFSDSRTGWIWATDLVDYFLWGTKDGGRTWVEQPRCRGALGLPTFLDRHIGILYRRVGGGGVWSTVSMVSMDGGQTWMEGSIPDLIPEELTRSGSLFASAWVTPALRWAFGNGHELWRWTPGVTSLSPVLVD